MQNQVITTESLKENTKSLSPDGNKLSLEATNTISKYLHILSLAKNIKLMDGTLKIWDQLITEDIKADNFEIEDFIKAVNIGIRTPMYNRIDYSDIYTEAKQLYTHRKLRNKNQNVLNNYEEQNKLPRSSMPTEVREIIKKALGK